MKNVKPGQFVVGSFFASDNTCAICQAGYQTSCIHGQPAAPDGAQAQRLRVPLADGTLVATPRSLPTTSSPADHRDEPARRPAGAGPGIRGHRHRRRTGDAGVARVKELTGGIGVHSVVEAVGTQESMMQAIGAPRPGVVCQRLRRQHARGLGPQ